MIGPVRRFLNKRLTTQFILIGLLFIGVRLIIGSGGLNSSSSDLLAPVAVLYTLFISFVISSQRSRYNSFFDSNRAESSVIYSMHLFSEVFSKEDRDAIKLLMDNYLMMQMDYKLVDYKETDKGFTALAEYYLNLKTHNDDQKTAKDNILDLIPSEQEKRYSMQTLLSERVAKSEWVTILSLYVATMYSFLIFKTPDVMSILIGALVCTAATMFVLVLYKLDNLSYRSNEKISEPIQRLFVDLGLLPYYSEPEIVAGRVKPPRGQRARVATYPHEYPDISDKKVEIKTF